VFLDRVIGYHGCDREDGVLAISNRKPLRPSNQKHDWLGNGTYFWESDLQRAREWAEYKRDHNKCKEPFVVGAIIRLGNCFDLTRRSNLDILASAYQGFAAAQAAAGVKMPENKNSPNVRSRNKVIRTLDCAVLNYLCETISETGQDFDTIRGVFVEGDPVYDGSEIFHKTHVQIAVRNPDCIEAMFLPV
jgi:hypothetical protein